MVEHDEVADSPSLGPTAGWSRRGLLTAGTVLVSMAAVGVGSPVVAAPVSTAPTWSGWFNLGRPSGGFIGGPATVSRNKDVCNIYVRGADNALWQRAYYNNRWHAWGRHNDGGVLASEPAPGSMGPNHEHVFVRGTDNNVWQKYWQ